MFDAFLGEKVRIRRFVGLFEACVSEPICRGSPFSRLITSYFLPMFRLPA